MTTYRCPVCCDRGYTNHLYEPCGKDAPHAVPCDCGQAIAKKTKRAKDVTP